MEISNFVGFSEPLKNIVLVLCCMLMCVPVQSLLNEGLVDFLWLYVGTCYNICRAETVATVILKDVLGDFVTEPMRTKVNHLDFCRF